MGSHGDWGLAGSSVAREAAPRSEEKGLELREPGPQGGVASWGRSQHLNQSKNPVARGDVPHRWHSGGTVAAAMPSKHQGGGKSNKLRP